MDGGIRNVDIFLFVKVLGCLSAGQVVEFVDISFAFFVGDSVRYQWLSARRLRV